MGNDAFLEQEVEVDNAFPVIAANQDDRDRLDGARLDQGECLEQFIERAKAARKGDQCTGALQEMHLAQRKVAELETQFRRLERTFAKVLESRDRDLLEYEDDVWNFFLNCWHLKDWIKNDTDGVAKATREKIDVEVNAHPALMMVGNLANKKTNFNVTKGVAKADSARRAQGRVSSTAYIDSRDASRNPGKDSQEILLLVIDKKGDEVAVKKLATDAMKNWMAIIKKYRI